MSSWERAEMLDIKLDAFFVWQMLKAICDVDELCTRDRIKARDAAERVYESLYEEPRT